MANRTVLISGAGIGGPALAFWLRRYGFAPTVVEVAPAPDPAGTPWTCAAPDARWSSGWGFLTRYGRSA